MAIYHLSVSTRARGYGASHAAYIERSGKYAVKEDLEASESGNMPAWAREDSARFWEAADLYERANGRAYTELEIALPRELSAEQRVELVRSFVQETLGDRHAYTWAIHNPPGGDGLEQPHVHIMFSERVVDGIDRDPDQYFSRWNAAHPERGGAGKDRSMSSRLFVGQVREAWAKTANRALEEAGLETRIDHRSYREIGLEQQSRVGELEPQMKRGASMHLAVRGVMSELANDVRAQMARNGERLIADPSIAIDALTAHQSVFTRRELERFVMGHTDGAEQFTQALNGVLASPQLLALQEKGKDGPSFVQRYTSSSVFEVEARLLQRVERLSGQEAQASVSDAAREAARSGRTFTVDQAQAFEQLVGTDRVATVHGAAGTGKSYVLSAMREAYEASGFTVHGAILQGKTAEDLERDSGIRSQTIHGFLNSVDKGYTTLDAKSVIVVDEAGMVGSQQMERLLERVESSGARMRLVGDTRQLHAVAFGDAFGQVAQRTPVAGLEKIQRQRVDWQRSASEAFSRHEIGVGLAAYGEQGQVRGFGSELEASDALLSQWAEDRAAHPSDSQVILAPTNVARETLNRRVREHRLSAGELGAESVVPTEKGSLKLAVGDRVMFGRNDYGALQVRNGTLGTVTGLQGSRLDVNLDSGRSVSFDSRQYGHLDYGYALTVHKAQGMTVDRAYVLATPTMSAESTYVAMTRHRQAVTLFYGQDAFAERGTLAEVLARPERKEFSARYEVIEAGGVRSFDAEERGPSGVRSGKSGVSGRRNLGMQREDLKKEKAAPAKQSWPELMARVAKMPIEEQAQLVDSLHQHVAKERSARIEPVADKARARYERRFAAAGQLAGAEPRAPKGLLSFARRGAYEREHAQWTQELQAAQQLSNQARDLSRSLSRAGSREVLERHARETVDRSTPNLVARVQAHRREQAAQQQAELERTLSRERGKDRGMER